MVDRSRTVETVTIAEPARGVVRASTFSSLRHRNYRLLWMGSLISSSGDWMDQIAFNWLVYAITGSAVALGLVNLCRLAPILVFTLVGGVIADRVERRRLMFTTQTVAMLLAFALAILVSTHLVQLWMVLVIAAARGVMMSFNQPARQSLISELVPKDDLTNAIALNSATLNMTRVFGPAIGGLLIASVGVAGAFYLNAASFLAVLYGLARMRFAARAPGAGGRRGLLGDLAEGLNYIRGQPALRTLVALALVPMVFGMPYMTMLTLFAKDVLQVGGGGLGLLTAASGVGAVLGALTVASLPGTAHRGHLMLAGLVAFGLALLAFSFSPWLWLSLATLVAVGLAQQVYMATNNTLIQAYAAEKYRGRVVSTLFLNRGMAPLGTMLASIGAALFSVRVAVGSMAFVLVVLAVLAARFAPAARDLS